MVQERHFAIKYYRDSERHYYNIILTEGAVILAQATGLDESTTLHMFVTLAGNALLSVKNRASLNARLEVLKRFASEIVCVGPFE